MDVKEPLVALTPIVCRRGVRALQPLAGAPVHLTISSQLWGIELSFQVPCRLPGSHPQTPRQRPSRRDSLCSQSSDVISTATDAATVGTADEAVAALRERLSVPESDGSSVADMLQSSGEAFDEPCLIRWLAARGHDTDEAEASLRQHAAWRSAYIPKGRVEEEEIANEMAMGKVFLQGCDRQGRPVMIVLAARHDMSARNIEETHRFIVYVLDNCAAAAGDRHLNPNGKFLCLFDLSGLRMNNLDVKALRGIFELLQSHFPERLGQLWFLNAPFIFWGLWRLVSPFIEPATRDKIVFLSGAERTQRLNAVIPAESLPRQYGGSADMVPIGEAVAARRAGKERAKARRRSTVERAAVEEGRLAAARNATGRWAAASWAAVKSGGSAVLHFRPPPPRMPRMPAIPHRHWWWQHSDGSDRPLQRKVSITLMRQKSMALQRAVSTMAASRLATASRLLLLPEFNPKRLLCKFWAQARRVWAWARAHTPALRSSNTGPPALPPSPLDGGLAPM